MITNLGKKIGIACVCIPRESYYWMEDWIKHYIKIGFDRITIYDNTGVSAGSPNRKKTVYYTGHLQQRGISKRGERYKELTSHLSDEDISEKLQNIVQKYSDKVDVIRWMLKNERGQIMHCQVEAYVDFCNRNRGKLDYITCLDMDEYLWFKPGHSLNKLLKQMENEDVNHFIMEERKFQKRWNESGPNDIKNFKEYLSGKRTCLKWIGNLNNMTGVNLHYACSYSKKANAKTAKFSEVAFNHYNSNEFKAGDFILIDENPYEFLETPEDNSKIEWVDIHYPTDNEWGFESLKLKTRIQS